MLFRRRRRDTARTTRHSYIKNGNTKLTIGKSGLGKLLVAQIQKMRLSVPQIQHHLSKQAIRPREPVPKRQPLAPDTIDNIQDPLWKIQRSTGSPTYHCLVQIEALLELIDS